MTKPLLLIAMLLLAIHVPAQMDLLLLKNKHRTVQVWTKGSEINFQFSNRQWIRGYIRDIRNDSLVVNMFSLVPVMTRWGTFMQDTMRHGMLKLHVKEIYAMPNRVRANAFNSGALLKAIGGAIVSLNVINSVIRNEQVFSGRNVRMMGIGAAVFGLGALSGAARKESLLIGKKYKLTILSGANVSAEK